MNIPTRLFLPPKVVVDTLGLVSGSVGKQWVMPLPGQRPLMTLVTPTSRQR